MSTPLCLLVRMPVCVVLCNLLGKYIYVARHSFVTVEEKGLPHELTLPGALLYQLLADTVSLKNQRLLHMVCVVEQFIYSPTYVQSCILVCRYVYVRTYIFCVCMHVYLCM